MQFDLTQLQSSVPTKPEPPAVGRPPVKPVRQQDASKNFSSALRQADRKDERPTADERAGSEASKTDGSARPSRRSSQGATQGQRAAREESRIRPSHGDESMETSRVAPTPADQSTVDQDNQAHSVSADQTTQSLLLAQSAPLPSLVPVVESAPDADASEKQGTMIISLQQEGPTALSAHPLFVTPEPDQAASLAIHLVDQQESLTAVENRSGQSSVFTPAAPTFDGSMETGDGESQSTALEPVAMPLPAQPEPRLSDRPADPSAKPTADIVKTEAAPSAPSPASSQPNPIVPPVGDVPVKSDMAALHREDLREQPDKPLEKPAAKLSKQAEGTDPVRPWKGAPSPDDHAGSDFSEQGGREQNRSSDRATPTFIPAFSVPATDPAHASIIASPDRGMTPNQAGMERPLPPAPVVPVRSPLDVEPAFLTNTRSVSFEVAQPDLGRVNVRVSLSQDLVHTHFSSDRTDVGQLLMGGQDRLQSALQASGFDMGQFRVSIDRQSDQQGGQAWLAQTYEDHNKRQRGQADRPQLPHETTRPMEAARGVNLFV